MALTTYTILLKNIRTELDEGRRRAKEAVQRHLVATYLKIGQMLHQHIDANTEDDSGRAGYGQGVIQELAVDVGISQQRLYEMLRVYRTFPIFRPAGKLGWTHFVLLASIKDPLERQFYLDQATRHRWSRPHLRAQIQARTHLLEASPESDPLTPRRGRLYTYRILKTNDHSMTFDLGMHHSATVNRAQLSPNTIPLTSSRGSREDTLPDHLESERPPRIERRAVSITKNDSTYALTEANPSRLYTYACTVLRIIDGDTTDVRLDLRFRFHTSPTDQAARHRHTRDEHARWPPRQSFRGGTSGPRRHHRRHDGKGRSLRTIRRRCVLREGMDEERADRATGAMPEPGVGGGGVGEDRFRRSSKTSVRFAYMFRNKAGALLTSHLRRRLRWACCLSPGALTREGGTSDLFGCGRPVLRSSSATEGGWPL